MSAAIVDLTDPDLIIIQDKDIQRLLRAELHNLRRRGAIRAGVGVVGGGVVVGGNVGTGTGGSLDRPSIETNRSRCSRCRTELGRIINRGAPCRSCRLRVCKTCREFSTRTTDWVCVVCHKQIELQAASGEWMNEFARELPRRDSTSDVLKKSIRRSWTISNPQQDRFPANRNNAEYNRAYSSLPPGQDVENYPSLLRHQPHQPYSDPNIEYPERDGFRDRSPQRRVLRQSTLPNPAPDTNIYYGNTLMPQASPIQLSPQYSPYNTDNENTMESTENEVPQNRYQFRRQSTLPCRPNEHHAQSKYLSTSPNRTYSRSPDKSDSEQQRYPPFVRQSTFPSNTNEPYLHQRPKILPTSPNRLSYNKSPERDTGADGDHQKRYPILRQATLPNPEQHIKLLPTSPPKKQLSPQIMKRSPEFTRQNTLPTPEGMNSLSMHHHGAKFLPISPRQKQNFLFPQPQVNPRPFLSQQNVPTMTEEQYSNPSPHREHSKMIKVRSHSNEEYSINRAIQPVEGRRMLPEIPPNRSPRLVRQDHVKEEVIRSNSESRSPIKKTFAEAKQNLIEYNNTLNYDEGNFVYCDNTSNYSDGKEMQMYDEEEENIYDRECEEQDACALKKGLAEDIKNKPSHTVRSAESFLNDSSPEYFHPEEYIRAVRKDRTRRRRSKEFIEPEVIISSNDDEPPKRKPEQMRSISEDTGTRIIKPVTRRSLSHPENNSSIKKTDTTKIPSPKPLTEMFERQKKEKVTKLPSPRRRTYKSTDHILETTTSQVNKISLQKRDSKSFDTVINKVILNDKTTCIKTEENKSQSMDESIFIEKDESNHDDNDGDADGDAVCDDKKNESLGEHKTTLGEAEIQCAVEAAAVIFKKVVLQRRKAAKKIADEGDTSYGGRNRKLSLMQDTDISDYESCNGLKMLNSDSDEYKLVFISSDSSSKEEEFEDSSSTTSSINTRHSISLDDCDWDYFEPGVCPKSIKLRDLSNSPNVCRKKIKLSPLGSPMLYRRDSPFSFRHKLRESDTGTDEELIAHAESSSSPTSSDSFLNQEIIYLKNPPKYSKFHKKTSQGCKNIETTTKGCNCGKQPHYVPIPVPYPVPIQTYQNWTQNDINNFLLDEDNCNKKKINQIQQKHNIDIFKLWNNAAPGLILQHKEQQQEHNEETEQQQQQQKQQQQCKPSQINTQPQIILQQTTGMFRNSTPVLTCDENSLPSLSLSLDQTICNNNNIIRDEVNIININNIIKNKLCENNLTNNVILSKNLKDKNNIYNNDKNIVDLRRVNLIEKTSDVDIVKCISEKNKSNKTLVHFNSIINSGSEVVKALSIDGAGNNIKLLRSYIVDDINSNNKKTGDMITIGKIKLDSDPSGYLQAENLFSSDSDSDSNEEENVERPNVQRSYDVAGASQEDELIASGYSDITSDNEERVSATSSVREDPSSSGSEATDTDDTGTVADRRPKSKRFNKVFVVNKIDSSSESDSQSSNGNPSQDSSDNDTDTEKDCGIILNYVKTLPDNEKSADSSDDSQNTNDSENDDNNENGNDIIVLNYAKSLSDDESFAGNNNKLFIENKINILDNQELDLNKTKDIHDIKQSSFNNICNKIITENKMVEITDKQYNVDNNINEDKNVVICVNNTKQNENKEISLINSIFVDLHEQPSKIEMENTKQNEIVAIEKINNSITSKSEYYLDHEIVLKELNKNHDNVIEHMVVQSSLTAYNINDDNIINNDYNKNSQVLVNDKETNSINNNGKCESDRVRDLKISSYIIINDDDNNLNHENDDDNGNYKSELNLLKETCFKTESSMKKQINKDDVISIEKEKKTVEEEFKNKEKNKEKVNEFINNKNCIIECTLTESEEAIRSNNNDHSNITPTTPGVLRSDNTNNTRITCESSFLNKIDPTTNANTNTHINTKNTEIIKNKTQTVEYEQSNSTDVQEDNENNTNNNNEDSENIINNVTALTKYTSLVMITQDTRTQSQVSVVKTNTTHIVSDEDSVIVKHTNWQSDVLDDIEPNSLAGYYTLSLEKEYPLGNSPRRPIKITTASTNNNINSNNSAIDNNNEIVICDNNNENVDDDYIIVDKTNNVNVNKNLKKKCESVLVNDDVVVVTGGNTLSAVVCLEDGLADDDSWVEEISQDEEEFATTTATESDIDSSEEITLSSTIDREEELRGYNRAAIDFTLHTIVEESCEESEVEQNPDKKGKNRMSASELEKYFFYGLGDGKPLTNLDSREDSMSESSSICSEGMDSMGGAEESLNDSNSAADLASSRLEKYFLSGFMGFSSERNDSDGSGSVGSDSEGRPSPEQRRKKLVRARGTGRSHSSSLDNLLAKEENEQQTGETLNESANSSETDTCDETVIHFEKGEGQSDTIKRKKQNKKRVDIDEGKKSLDFSQDTKDNNSDASEDEERRTPQPEFLLPPNNLAQSKKQHSRDSGFIGSNDDLLLNDTKSPEVKIELEEIEEEYKSDNKENENAQSSQTEPSTTGLTRKDSFNNWSSDEETNLMMSKMRQFFKTLVAASANAQNKVNNSKNTTPVVSESNTPKNGTPVPKPRNRNKPPQLVYFENELTRLMKTVPGINDEQVREIVEYLSSEDTWSDSYDSSDYTSSDLEGGAIGTKKTELQEQISASCQQIINNFESSLNDEEGDRGDGGLYDENQVINRDTAVVYQKLVASFSKIASGEEKPINPNNSPPLFSKLLHHIGTRLVALMHEVSSSESHASTSPRAAARYHRKLQPKISNTTTEDDDSTSDSNLEKKDLNLINLPRSKSHDLLLGESRPHHQSSSGVSDTAAEEKEASDYERFSWRGSFESALLATNDSRTKLSLLDNSASTSALAAKRRSAGDLLFNHKSLSREQLDRVRSCGSIGGDHDIEESKLWGTNNQRTGRRRSSVPDATCDSENNSSEDDAPLSNRSTLPRSLQNTTSASTNSLPRLSTTNLQTASTSTQKSQGSYHFLQNNVKSARYRPPGYNRPNSTPKRTSSAPGLQLLQQPLLYPRRDNRRKLHSSYEEANAAEIKNSPPICERDPVFSTVGASNNSVGSNPNIGNSNIGIINNINNNGRNSTSPVASRGSASSDPWPSQSDEDIDRLVALHRNRNSLSSLGVRSDSMASVYSGAGEGRYYTVTVKGQVEFGMQYNYKQGALEIHVVQCKELASVDTKRNRSDPYVKVYLLPDKSKGGKRKTKVKKHTLNPVFDETLKFHMSLSSLESRTLWLTVWHSDMFGRNDFLGEVTIVLQGKVFDNTQPQWYPLQERSEPFDDLPTYKGDIIVGLKFIPPESGQSLTTSGRKFSTKSLTSTRGNSKGGSLHVLVKEAKNLTPVKANGNCDAFCKSYLLPDKNRSSKQKTPVIKRTVNPVWNYTFIYDDVTLAELSERALELTLWDHDRLSSNEFLGGVRFSLGTGEFQNMDSNGKELSLWQNMINRPNFWVEGCLPLRSSLDPTVRITS